ncbi:hypothetical protein CC78DRAFT_586827 [Lojkania enalia]|uniref:Uncharacterized protein n=1 Tax=Lojkania enalia TaxID=147567 RepID=A0A9P4JY59_9PLEO|nr:hypothetical protein CC78DRAFT_586827 [Didymosphaeria enalia]
MSEGTRDYELVNKPFETPPPYSTAWGHDIVQDSDNNRTRRGPRLPTYDSVKHRVSSLIQATLSFLQETVWPRIKEFRFTKKQTYAFLLLLVFGILPFAIVGHFTKDYDGHPFNYAFGTKVISCGESFGEPQNSTVSGTEALFVLDFTFGKFPFSQVKIIDVAWDICLGRGAQLLAWFLSYVVFTDSLLRVIERHPASYETFTHICLEGPCIASMWSLCRDLGRTHSKRTWALFFYMLLSSAYVLSVPTILSAMTGYVSTSISWVDVEGSDQIVPASNFHYSYIVYNAGNVTFNNTCSVNDQLMNFVTDKNARWSFCDCQLPNGTVLAYSTWVNILPYENQRIRYNESRQHLYPQNCTFYFPDNTKTYPNPNSGLEELACNAAYNITIFGNQYNASTLNYSSGYCTKDSDHGYDSLDLFGRSRCLPDTANEAYEWGFSTMLSAVFVIMQFVWTITMYVVWQDAQFSSHLVKSGYHMTMLRAAFAATVAARWKTGVGGRELVRTDTKNLERELYGGGSKKRSERAEVRIDVFREDKVLDEESEEEGLRLRRRTWSMRNGEDET